MADEILMAFIDYENLRRGFKNYVEYITVEDIIGAFQDLASELGTLRGMFFYGDWTRRPQDARAIEDRGYRAVNVLSTRFGRDRSDTPMSFNIYDTARENAEVTAFILGSGDADFKEAVIRAREHGKRVYVLCFGASAARELFTLTQGVFPLEARLNLSEQVQVQPRMPGLERPEAEATSLELVRRLDAVEKSLPYVVRNYFRDRILLPAQRFGETAADVDGLLDRARDEKSIDEYEVSNPRLAGRTVKAIRLNRDSPTVQNALKPSNERTG